jgi:hypothetical protein
MSFSQRQAFGYQPLGNRNDLHYHQYKSLLYFHKEKLLPYGCNALLSALPLTDQNIILKVRHLATLHVIYIKEFPIAISFGIFSPNTFQRQFNIINQANLHSFDKQVYLGIYSLVEVCYCLVFSLYHAYIL